MRLIQITYKEHVEHHDSVYISIIYIYKYSSLEDYVSDLITSWYCYIIILY